MRNINVIFDNQIFNLQKFGGISRYFVELFKELDKNKNIKWDMLGLTSRNAYLQKEHNALGKIQVGNWNFKGSLRLINILNKIAYFTPFRRKRIKPDLYHFTYYDGFYFKRLDSGIPRIVTVYDMIHQILGGDSGTIQAQKDIICAADLIFAISQSTANDIQKYLNIPSEKIVVTHLASSLQPVEYFSGVSLPQRYILFVGNREWYKNFMTFIEAISSLLNNDPDLSVLCAGGPEFTPDELSLFRETKIVHQVIHMSIGSDEQLAWYYQNALFFVFPSLYEGFGIPILEAMNCNCPVVASDSSSLKEVAGDAAYFFDPNSKESIYGACRSVLDSEVLRLELIERGKIRRMDFSWQKTAEQTIKAYYKLLDA